MSQTSSLSRFWWKWIAANGIGELAGLGGVALLGYVAFRHFGEPTGFAQATAVGVSMVVLGAYEGAIVGLAQARVLREFLPGLRGWVRATVVGAMVAWAVGMLPSTIMSLGETSASPPGAEPALPIVLLLAAGMGLVAGPVLAFFQWLRLRTVIRRGAALWLPANAAAWALGMPVIFLGAQANEIGANETVTAFAVAFALLISGVVVGAVHGRFLVWMVQHQAK